MEKIIVVEDDEGIREEIKSFLGKYGYDVIAPTEFNNIIEFIEKEQSDLILLDINLPVFDGYYICREVRKKSEVPIIIVTSRDSDMDELMSMNLGADDFVTKPYNTQILLARISSILKRAYHNNDVEIMIHKDLKYNISTSEMSIKENIVELTKNESKILNILMKNKEKIVSRDEIIKALWQSDEFIDDNTLTVNINRLRRKIEDIGGEGYLQTKRGQGYMLG